MHTLSKDGFQKFKIDKKKFFLLEKFLNNVKKITNNTLIKNRCNFSSLENFHNDTDENKNINDIKLNTKENTEIKLGASQIGSKFKKYLSKIGEVILLYSIESFLQEYLKFFKFIKSCSSIYFLDI